MEKKIWWFSCLIFLVMSTCYGRNVTYDGRSLIINGQHKIIFSGSIHYPRSTPEMWPSLIAKAKEGGLDAIQTYVFWNIHEPLKGQYDFSGRHDIIRFIKEIHAQGLYVSLRIGPFIEAEWNYGGLPFWLHDIPGIIFRSDNGPFKYHMQTFVTKIVNMMKAEKLYASQGGPIILSQIENEYNTIEPAFHEKGPSYVRWAAAMAVGLQTGVPWIMCKQNDAPGPVINTCNGMRCGETFPGPNSPNKPAMWTENWTSFYQAYGGETYLRSAEDIAFHVALFIAKRGSYVNYYMYHGGTNFGRTAAAYMVTSYYDQAPLDEYGLIRQPKWGHLKGLHATIKLCIKSLLYGTHSIVPLGQLQQAYVFKEDSGECAAFLVNNDNNKDVEIVFQKMPFSLPRKSISILPDCKTIAFNTAKVSTQHNTRSWILNQRFDSVERWEVYKEPIPNFSTTAIRAQRLLEHMSTTKDRSDYLWYTSRFQHNSSDAKAVLNVQSRGHILHSFVNGVHTGSGHGSHQTASFGLEKPIYLKQGPNNVALLSVTVGLPDSGAYLEHHAAGLSKVTIQNKDITDYSWGYQVGLLGEKLNIYTEEGSNQITWQHFRSVQQPLTWYKTHFNAPVGNDPVALNLGSMGKGEAWVNGFSIGRYWVSFHTPNGKPSQARYNVPRSFLRVGSNLLVILEEETGYPPGITIDTVSITKVCGHVTETHLPPWTSWVAEGQSKTTEKKKPERQPTVQLKCPQGRNISKILFASFGTPSGDCGSYAIGSCHSSNSKTIVEEACLEKSQCSIPQSTQYFGGDPCPGIPKALLVHAQCT